jgi:hypothetical protein
MEPENDNQKYLQKNKVVIKSPLRLALFSVAILMLAAFAMRLIAEPAPVMSAAAF